MPFVSDTLISKTWKRLGKMDGREIISLQKRHSRAQNALTKVVYADIDDFREDAFGILLFVFHVVLEAFEKAKPKPKRIGINSIKRAIGKIESNSTIDIDSKIAGSSEPHVLQYVYEAFTVPDDEVVLSSLEFEKFFLKMEVVVECLHSDCQKR